MSNNKKDVKALILSGGGVKGTFQYGAVDYIYNHVLEKGEKFKIVCGVSAGALTGSIIAQDKFQLGKDIWMNQIKKRVPAFKMKFPIFALILYGILPGIALLIKLKNTDSLFKNEKLREIVNEVCKDLVQILEKDETYLRLGIVEYQTGEYKSVDPTISKYRDRVADVIMASTSIPLAFPPVRMNKEKEYQYFDGGVINITPFKDIFDITRQPDFQKKYNLESIYAVLCSPISNRESHQYYKGLFDIASRTLDILCKEIYLNDKEVFDRTNAFVWFRDEIEKKFPDKKEELEKIYKQILKETDIDIKKYFTSTCKVIAPDPEKWKDFLESDLYPDGPQEPVKKGDNSEKLFWKQFPSTLTKDPKKLMAAYHFGLFMAREILKPKKLR